jgi:hypothetical protein
MTNVREKKKKIWFRAKEYGWGWYPISWEGWGSIGIFALIYVIVLIWLLNQRNLLNMVLGIIVIFILLGILLIICYKKGETPGWRWNGKIVKKGGNKK